MNPSMHTVLVEVVSRAQECGDPVSERALADSLGVPEATLADPLDTLCELELVEPTDGGYRPTVTAHELLALDVDFDDVLVLDIVDE